MNILKFVYPFFLLLFLQSCNKNPGKGFTIPQNLNDGWLISSPEQSGINRKKLEELIGEIEYDNPELNSLVVARHGKIIVDEYFNGYHPDSLQKIWSVTKTITGIIVGIAADNNLLSEKDSIYKHLDPYIHKFDSSKKAITVEHLLTMTSGLEWVELGGPNSAGFKLAYSKDWIDFTLSQPLIKVPGTCFNYSSGNTMLLAPIIKSSTGTQVKEYADEFLFVPLGIAKYQWDKQGEFWNKTQGGELPGAKKPVDLKFKKSFFEYTNTGSGLRMRSRDLCKIGQLYLNNGKWNGRQVVSEEWIKRSRVPHFGNSNYGYLWRLTSIGNSICYYATGFGLQRIFVFPEKDLVIVMTQKHYETMPQGEKWTNRFVNSFLHILEH
ncbi:MAG: serine hydrolase [Flavobacteriales bacterium]|nr:serine hydrolase [Flavobacteriales bacterium]